MRHALTPDLKATGQIAGLGFIHRKLAASDVYFVVNTSNVPIDGTIQFRVARSTVEAWDPTSGAVLTSGHSTSVPLALAPYESRVFVLKGALFTVRAGTEKIQGESAKPTDEQLADLNGGWQVRFGDASQSLSTLTSWTEIPGRKFYSGEAIYSRGFMIDSKHLMSVSSPILIDFGAGTPIEDKRQPNASGMSALLDPPVREAAIVFVNGKRAGSLWHPPYRIDVSKLVHGGENQLEVHVYNTAINLLAGQPPRDYTALRAKYGRRFDPQDMDNLKPIPSGLFGPIRLIEERHP